MATLQELRDRRATAWAQAQEYNTRDERGDNLSAEDEQAWERALADVDDLTAKIERKERQTALDERFDDIDAEERERREHDERQGRRNAGDPADARRGDAYWDAFIRWCRDGFAGLTPEEQQTLRNGQAPSDDPAMRMARAMGTAGSVGGYTVPQGFWAKVTETMLFYANVMALSDHLVTDGGEKIPWPTMNDTGNEGALLSEGNPAGEQDILTGQAALDAWTYTSKIVRVAFQLLQDTGVNLDERIPRLLGERLGRIVNRHFTVGDGAEKPQGYVTGSTVGKTAAAVAAITYDELIDLEHSVDAAYRDAGNCRFMWHDLTLAFVRKLKDGDNRPLWVPSVVQGTPDTFNGRPYSVNNYMAPITDGASAKTVAFGDFRAGFATRSVRTGVMMRLTERYAEYGQVGFLGFGRHDSVVQDTSAIKLLQQAAS